MSNAIIRYLFIMKISVIIPAYNEERYIAKTIEAILKQDYPDFEVIVVNNNSDDGTVAVVSPFLSDQRIRLIHETAQGLLFARNAGLHAAKGTVIAQLDADCIPDQQWLSLGQSYFRDPAVVGVSGPYNYYDATWPERVLMLLLQKIIFSITSWYVQKTKKGAILVGGNSFIRVSALQKAGGYNTRLQFYAEDTDTALRIAKYGKVIYSRSLVIKTSARRFATQGFFAIQRKYNNAFISMIRGLPITQEITEETIHPR